MEIWEVWRQSPGHLSTDAIRSVSGHDSCAVIIRFAGVEQLKACIESDAQRDFLQRIDHALEKADRYVIKTGMAF